MKIIAATLIALGAFAAPASQVIVATNHLSVPTGQALERVAFAVAPSVEMNGTTYDDSFWMAAEDLNLGGKFGNDVWGLANNVNLTGTFADHVRVIGRMIKVDGFVSNGLWAAGVSIVTSTNTTLAGEQFLIGDNLILQGHVDGNVYARGRQITIGGTISGDVYLQGDDIVVRPGTIIAGNLIYVSTNQTIVLDDQSHVRGDLRKIDPPSAIEPVLSPGTAGLVQLFWFAGSLVAGIPFIMLFPGFTGSAVQQLRGGLWKCGVAGLVALFLVPFFIIAVAFTIIGLPLSLVLAAGYALILYLGKFPVALAIGTALLQRRGQISLSAAVLALVSGLILYYGMALAPYVGSSLQTAASAFGAGSIIMTLAARRGNVRAEEPS